MSTFYLHFASALASLSLQYVSFCPETDSINSHERMWIVCATKKKHMNAIFFCTHSILNAVEFSSPKKCIWFILSLLLEVFHSSFLIPIKPISSDLSVRRDMTMKGLHVSALCKVNKGGGKICNSMTARQILELHCRMTILAAFRQVVALYCSSMHCIATPLSGGRGAAAKCIEFHFHRESTKLSFGFLIIVECNFKYIIHRDESDDVSWSRMDGCPNEGLLAVNQSKLLFVDVNFSV